MTSELNKQHTQGALNKPRCRRCGGTDCYRIHRGLVAKRLLGFLPLRRYQCGRCLNKFYVL